MNLSVIDENAKQKIAQAISYAEQHPYKPWEGHPCPGDNPEYVTKIGAFRIVFTLTHSDGRVFRDLSISISGNKLPNQVAVFMIAHHFGFTGYDVNKPVIPGKNWAIDIGKRVRFIRCVEPIEEEKE